MVATAKMDAPRSATQARIREIEQELGQVAVNRQSLEFSLWYTIVTDEARASGETELRGHNEREHQLREELRQIKADILQ